MASAKKVEKKLKKLEKRVEKAQKAEQAAVEQGRRLQELASEQSKEIEGLRQQLQCLTETSLVPPKPQPQSRSKPKSKPAPKKAAQPKADSSRAETAAPLQRQNWKRFSYLRDRYEFHLKSQSKAKARVSANQDLIRTYGEESGYSEEQLECILT
jgi:hypothetical protein